MRGSTYSKNRSTNISLVSYTTTTHANGTMDPVGITTHNDTETFSDNGFKTEEWKARIRAGYDATTSRTVVHVVPTVEPGSVSWATGGITAPNLNVSQTIQGEILSPVPYNIGFPSSPAGSDQTVVDTVIAGLVHNAYQEITTFNGGAFLGEIRDTIHQIRHPLDGLTKFTKTWLERNKKAWRLQFVRAKQRGLKPPKAASLVSKAIGESWLEYSFGWKPLVADLNDAAKALAEHENFKPSRFIVRAKHSIELGSPYSYQQHGFVSVGKVGFDSYTTARYTISGKGAACIETVPSNVGNVNVANFGLSLDDFYPTLWEIIPYSFLFDYVSNINVLLESFKVRNQRFIWGWVSRRHDCHVNVGCSLNMEQTRNAFVPYDTFGSAGGNPGSSHTSYFALYRVVLPDLWVTPRIFSPGPSLARLANLTSLFVTGRRTEKFILGSDYRIKTT